MAKRLGKFRNPLENMDQEELSSSLSPFIAMPSPSENAKDHWVLPKDKWDDKNPNNATSTQTTSALTAPATIPIGPNVIELTGADANATTRPNYFLSVGQSARGNISTGGDRDYYQVNLTAGQTYTFAQIGTGVSALRDTYLNLRDSSGKVVAFNNDSGPGLSSLLTFTPKTTGNYLIDAGANSRTATGEYGISVTAGTKASFNIEMGAGALDSYTSWTNVNTQTAVTLTYGFRSSAPTTYSGPANFSVLSLNQITAVKSILSLWSDVANVKFTQVIGNTINGVNEYSNNATILIGNYSANDGAGAFAYYPGSTSASSAAGDLWLNLSGGVTLNGVIPGSYGYFAIMHELGHALGLAHPGDYNAGAGGTITYASNAQFIQDSEQYSAMSYFGGSYTGQSPGGFASGYTPMLLDIYEIQQMYGANTTTRTGDNVYGFGSNAGAQYDFSTVASPQFCIWDAGGQDTLNCSAYSGSQIINLTAGSFSSVVGATNNVSIALGALVENAVGGSGDDTILGNSLANNIIGGSGNDTLTGGAGADQFIFNTALNASINLDRITDFVSNQDKIALSKSIMSGLGSLGTLSIDDFVIGSSASDTTDRVIYNFTNGTLYYDPDGSNSQAQIAFAVLGDSSIPTINYTDLIIIA